MDGPIIPEPKEKTSKEVFFDYLGEIIGEFIGIEKGFYRTFSDLRKQPNVVVKSYLAKEGIYSSPFKLLITLTVGWIAVNNFVIDWYEVWRNYLISLDKFYELHINHNSESTSMKSILLWSEFAGDLVSKYFLVMVLFTTPLQAYISYKLCKPYKIEFKTHFAVTGYTLSLGVVSGFFFIILIAINFWLAMTVVFIIMLLPMIGLSRISNLFSVVRVSRFFEENGIDIERNYYRAKNLIGIFIAIFVAAVLVVIDKAQ